MPATTTAHRTARDCMYWRHTDISCHSPQNSGVRLDFFSSARRGHSTTHLLRKIYDSVCHHGWKAWNYDPMAGWQRKSCVGPPKRRCIHLPKGCVIEVGVLGDNDILDSDHVLLAAKVTSRWCCAPLGTLGHLYPLSPRCDFLPSRPPFDLLSRCSWISETIGGYGGYKQVYSNRMLPSAFIPCQARSGGC